MSRMIFRGIFYFGYMKILMVCLGNICRSPLAEGLLRQKLKEAGADDFEVDSAGTGGWHSGEAPDKRAIAVAAKYGLDISKQCARKFHPDDFDKFDFIFAMDASNFNDLSAMARGSTQREKLHPFLPFAGINDPSEVPDPWYGGAQDFEDVYRLLDQACEVAAAKLLKINH